MAGVRIHGTIAFDSLGFVLVAVVVLVYHTNTGKLTDMETEGAEYWQQHSNAAKKYEEYHSGSGGLDSIKLASTLKRKANR